MCRPWGHPHTYACEPNLACAPSQTCTQVEEDAPLSMPPTNIYEDVGSEEQLAAMGAVFGRLSGIVYADEYQQEEDVAELQMTHRAYIEEGLGTQAMVVEDGEAIVVVVRGTQGEEAIDWLVDLQAQPVPLPGYGNVHHGFAHSAQAIAESVQQAIDGLQDANDSRPVWLAGHSLGGAVAFILAILLEREGYDVSGVMTFGAPAAGDAVWRDSYDARLGAVTHRWLRGEDVVPCLPAAGYWRHVGSQHYLGDDGVQFYDETDHCPDLPNVLNPAAAICENEGKVGRYFRRIFLDPGNFFCAAPDPMAGVLNALFAYASGRNTGDHAINKYVTSLQNQL